MRTLLTPLILLIGWLNASSFVTATKACPAFNNLKHTKNSGNQTLQIGHSYSVLEEKKDNFYIQIPNISTPNRWVSQECFALSKDKQDKQDKQTTEPNQQIPSDNYNQKSENLLLALSWHNTFCQRNQQKTECRRAAYNFRHDNRFSLHGLWPQPIGNEYCNVPYDQKGYDKRHQWYKIDALDLSEATLKELTEIMPGTASSLHKHEWIKHGTCYGTSAEQYFQNAITLANQVNRSKLANFIQANQGKIVTLQQIRFKADESFGKGSGKSVEMRCDKKSGLLTEIWFHLNGKGDNLSALLKEGPNIRSYCTKARIDSAGF